MAAVRVPEVLDLAGLDALLRLLRDTGWRVVGPRVRDGVVVIDDVRGVDDLPRGVTDEQAPGHYRTSVSDGPDRFGYAVGPQSAKTWLFPSRELVRSTEADRAEPDRVALIGVRSCDLAALSRLDHVLDRRGVTDPGYVERRRRTLLIAVTCTRPAATCLCTATGTGPVPDPAAADVTLTELVDADGHRFVARAGTDAGADLLARTPTRAVRDRDLAAEEQAVDVAERSMTRTLPADLPEVLRRSTDASLWKDVADRCLSCGSCTLVCPTCFCTSTEDVSDLVTGESSRYRTWESCFASAHSFANGGPVRGSVESRYRQWATHKLSSWWDQFGESGCVGCGRCVTWCPAGIDLFEEMHHLAALAGAEEVGSHA